MNSQPEAPAIPCPAPGRKRRAVLWLASVTLLLVAFGWFFALRPLAGSNLVWLTPAQFARTTQAGPWTNLKNKIARIVAPWGVFNWRHRPNILVRSTLVALTSDAAQRDGLPAAAAATNADGTRVWILSSAELKVLQQRLKATPSASVQNEASILTLSGRPATVMVGNAPRSASVTTTASGGIVPRMVGNAPQSASGTTRLAGVVTRTAASPTPQPQPALAGLRIDLNPKFAAGSINVTLGATATETMQNDPAVVRTNLAVTCRASLANAGALLVDAGEATNSGGTNYWLIVSPAAVDARGNPL